MKIKYINTYKMDTSQSKISTLPDIIYALKLNEKEVSTTEELLKSVYKERTRLNNLKASLSIIGILNFNLSDFVSIPTYTPFDNIMNMLDIISRTHHFKLSGDMTTQVYPSYGFKKSPVVTFIFYWRGNGTFPIDGEIDILLSDPKDIIDEDMCKDKSIQNSCYAITQDTEEKYFLNTYKQFKKKKLRDIVLVKAVSPLRLTILYI